MQREPRPTKTPERTVTFCARSLWLRARCGHRPLWVVGHLSCSSDHSSVVFCNMESAIAKPGEKGITFSLLFETDVTFLRPVCFQDCGGLIFETVLLQYV